MPETDLEPAEVAPPWSARRRAVAAVAWGGFLAACAGSLLCFALVDPIEVTDALWPELELDRMTGYAAGFFFFWFVGCAGALVVASLSSFDDG